MKKLSLSISSFCKTGSGTTPSRSKYDRYFGGGIPWVKSGELRESIISNSEETITEEALAETALKIAPKGAILVAMYGANVGRVGILDIDATTNQAICHIVPEKDKADSRYIFHALQQKLPEFISRSVGGAQPNISQQIIRDTKIFLPPIDQQKRIAAILDKAEELRRLRRQSIEQLDILGRSIFIEMFGDPIFNQHKWQRTQLVNLCISPDNIKCGPFGTQLSKDEYKTEGVPLWGIRNVNALFKIPTKEFLELKTANKLIQYSIQSGDIVMTRKGTVGNCAVYPEGYPLGIMHSDLLRLRINYQVCNPIFLSHQLHYSRDVAQQIELISGGAIMPGINVTNLKSLEVLTPPHPLQQEFAQRIEAIEHQKSQHRESLAQLDKLFASLQHRAFRGEL
jgi:type I restriction enzyme, S subunit